jgi:hypothetical protein
VNGETVAVLSGSPALDTPATTNSPVGTYPITAGVGTLSALNYAFSFTNGVLTVTQAPLAVLVRPTILLIPGLTTSHVVIRWNAISNVTYRVQYKSDLGSASWLNLVPDVIATSNQASFVDNPGGAPRRFYRVIIAG